MDQERKDGEDGGASAMPTFNRDFFRRKVVVSIENDLIGDGLFAPEVAKTLRELADLIDQRKAGNNGIEVYQGPRGSVAVIKSDDLLGICIPYQIIEMRFQADDPVSGPS